MQQLLPFALPEPPQDAANYIITDANRLAHKAVIEHRWDLPLMLLFGAHYSGKTLLASQWATKHDAVMLDTSLSDEVISTITARAYIVDDVDACDERQLFHLLNMINSHNALLLMTATGDFASLPFTLADTLSRLRVASQVHILPPDDEMMTLLLHHHFTLRQLHYDEKLLDYIVPRLERSYAALHHFVIAMDEASLTEKRSLNVTLARNILSTSRFS
jgi:chromosomal replication initiation ATPase DnaA